MTLASLPTLSVQIAFNPTNVQSLTQTWTDVTPYVRDFTTKLGRQHFLDRVEAGTLNMTVNERTGFFLNGSVNGTGYVIQPRLPIKVTATWGIDRGAWVPPGSGLVRKYGRTGRLVVSNCLYRHPIAGGSAVLGAPIWKEKIRAE